MARAYDRAVAAQADANAEIIAPCSVTGENLSLLRPDRAAPRKDIGRAATEHSQHIAIDVTILLGRTDDERVTVGGETAAEQVSIAGVTAGPRRVGSV